MLANEATRILHGEKASSKAAQTAEQTFRKQGIGSDLPVINVKLSEIKKGISLLEFVNDNKILSSKSEARRVIANKGLKINNQIIENDKKILNLGDFENKSLKFSFGKKKHYLIKII